MDGRGMCLLEHSSTTRGSGSAGSLATPSGPRPRPSRKVPTCTHASLLPGMHAAWPLPTLLILDLLTSSLYALSRWHLLTGEPAPNADRLVFRSCKLHMRPPQCHGSFSALTLPSLPAHQVHIGPKAQENRFASRNTPLSMPDFCYCFGGVAAGGVACASPLSERCIPQYGLLITIPLLHLPPPPRRPHSPDRPIRPLLPLPISLFSCRGSRVQEMVGGRVRLMFSGSAPLSAEVASFLSVCIAPIIEGYGLTGPPHPPIPLRAPHNPGGCGDGGGATGVAFAALLLGCSVAVMNLYVISGARTQASPVCGRGWERAEK